MAKLAGDITRTAEAVSQAVVTTREDLTEKIRELERRIDWKVEGVIESAGRQIDMVATSLSEARAELWDHSKHSHLQAQLGMAEVTALFERVTGELRDRIATMGPTEGSGVMGTPIDPAHLETLRELRERVYTMEGELRCAVHRIGECEAQGVQRPEVRLLQELTRMRGEIDECRETMGRLVERHKETLEHTQRTMQETLVQVRAHQNEYATTLQGQLQAIRNSTLEGLRSREAW